MAAVGEDGQAVSAPARLPLSVWDTINLFRSYISGAIRQRGVINIRHEAGQMLSTLLDQALANSVCSTLVIQYYLLACNRCLLPRSISTRHDSIFCGLSCLYQAYAAKQGMGCSPVIYEPLANMVGDVLPQLVKKQEPTNPPKPPERRSTIAGLRASSINHSISAVNHHPHELNRQEAIAVPLLDEIRLRLSQQLDSGCNDGMR